MCGRVDLGCLLLGDFRIKAHPQPLTKEIAENAERSLNCFLCDLGVLGG
jgi:hypothetical protein